MDNRYQHLSTSRQARHEIKHRTHLPLPGQLGPARKFFAELEQGAEVSAYRTVHYDLQFFERLQRRGQFCEAHTRGGQCEEEPSRRFGERETKRGPKLAIERADLK